MATQRRISPSVACISEKRSAPCPWSQSSSVLKGSSKALPQEPEVAGMASRRKQTGQRLLWSKLVQRKMNMAASTEPQSISMPSTNLEGEMASATRQ